MTTEPMLWLIAATAGLAALAITAAALLKGWRGWLELRRLEIGQAVPGTPPSPAARIELADLKERVRKLEAIAAGVEY